jgi:hypothetical protein
MKKRARRNHSPVFKAKVALAVVADAGQFAFAVGA